MDEKAWRYGCLFCRTGTEATIAGYINQTITNVEAVAPTRTRHKTVAGKAVEDQVQLLPGYFFFRTESDKPLSLLTRITNVLKLLEYDNLSWELTGDDREFADSCLTMTCFNHRTLHLSTESSISRMASSTDMTMPCCA